MRTYRTVFVSGIVLWALGWLLGATSGSTTFAAVGWLGQLLIVIGAAGMVMVFVIRQVMKRRLTPPGDPASGGSDRR